MRDLVTQRPVSIDPAGSSADIEQVVNQYGVGVKNPSGFRRGYKTALAPSSVRSILAVGGILAADGRGAFVCSDAADYFGFAGITVPQMNFAYSSVVVGSTSVVAGQTYALGARVKAQDYALVMDGMIEGGASTNYGTFAGASLNLLGVPGGGFSNSSMFMHMLALWDRPQENLELQELTLNPWQLVTQDPPVTYFFPSGWAFDESIYPNGVSLTQLAGAYTDIDESPDAPDGNWLTAT